MELHDINIEINKRIKDLPPKPIDMPTVQYERNVAWHRLVIAEHHEKWLKQQFDAAKAELAILRKSIADLTEARDAALADRQKLAEELEVERRRSESAIALARAYEPERAAMRK